MILVWSGEGGPLQYLGLALFLFQFLVPQIFQFTVDLGGAAVETGNSEPLMLAVVSVAAAICIGSIWAAWEWISERGAIGTRGGEWHQPRDAGDNTRYNPEGLAANPVAIDDDSGGNNTAYSFWTWLTRKLNSLVERFSPVHLMLSLAFIIPFAMIAPLIGTRSLEDPSVTQVTAFAIITHSMMAIAAYRVLRDVLDVGGAGPYPGMRRGREGLRRKLTVGEIADIVRKVTVEEFISEEDVKRGDCSISRLKRMLENRGASEAAGRCLTREDLEKEVLLVRKFNDECAICAEEYSEG
ncbi:hypothetical protein ACHAWF_003166 [Thalassiosira exigua]